MPSLTPIRIRGKRNATKQEKWHYGKQRKPHRTKPRNDSDRTSSTASISSGKSSMTQRPRKEYDPKLSRLEQLPTEVIQSIFQHAANVDLPLVSARLATQLASRHLYHQLTSNVLQPILCGADSTTVHINAVMRLMSSRFFTWSFFKDWLRMEFDSRGLSETWHNEVGSDSVTSAQPGRQEEWTWYKLRPSGRLLPPKKLLRGPFTADNIRFLNFITSPFRGDPDEIDALYSEVVREGLERAVAEGAIDALPSFWTLGMQPNTELLRQAVINGGCGKMLVHKLVTRVLHLNSDPVDINFLDPALWSWADKAIRSHDEKGRWLIRLLKDAAGISNRKGEESKGGK